MSCMKLVMVGINGSGGDDDDVGGGGVEDISDTVYCG